ncbi:ubiquitin-conjugating enzyme E2 D4-like isoform X2 [Branchiostoma floridae]|uniref:Ubiquitin-conjugating enzyme E2 D4-like isoform X2 n=1 Tax=Branchiostoma floridae TaxID=7739 RepID=A0A9J7LPV1_BRAFL|nr:ubiquitin-conjugating enzyme E2 D4-like isoform X2 [Branchiostoma floridae]
MEKQFATRVQKELAALRKSCPLGIQVSLPSDNLHEWEAVIPGPEDSLYKGGKFKIRLLLPENYPLAPPVVHFLTPIYHLNVSQVCGQVCLRFLSEDEWVAGGTIEQVLSALFSLLIRPEENNAFDHDVLNTYHHFRRQYNKMACNSAKKAK